MNLDFAIRSWSAWGPGLSAADHWLHWAQQPGLPMGEEAQPELRQMPAMARRRLNPLGRSAVQVMYDTRGSMTGQATALAPHASLASVPVVLGSRYGDATRSLELLAQMVRGEALSPTAFGMSVHNAIGAAYSIACGDHANYLSVAAGAASAAAALVEALGLLAEGAPEVLVVCYDAPLPGAYQTFQDEPCALYAWAWCVTRPAQGLATWRLGWEAEAASRAPALAASSPPTAELPPAPQLPFGLDLLRAVLAAGGEVGAASPIWQRTAEARLWSLTAMAPGAVPHA